MICLFSHSWFAFLTSLGCTAPPSIESNTCHFVPRDWFLSSKPLSCYLYLMYLFKCPKQCILMYCIFLYCDLHLLGNNIIFHLHINWKLYLFGNEEVEEWPQLISLQAAGQAFAQKVKQTPKLNGLAKKGQTNKKWKCWNEWSNKRICQKKVKETPKINGLAKKGQRKWSCFKKGQINGLVKKS